VKVGKMKLSERTKSKRLHKGFDPGLTEVSTGGGRKKGEETPDGGKKKKRQKKAAGGVGRVRKLYGDEDKGGGEVVFWTHH